MGRSQSTTVRPREDVLLRPRYSSGRRLGRGPRRADVRAAVMLNRASASRSLRVKRQVR